MLYLLIFFLGGAVGSFVNVLVSHSVAGKDWVRGRSHCDHCRKPLTWYDMVPLLSFFLYGARSRCCAKQLSWQHPMVEAMFGILFVWWGLGLTLFFRLVSEPLLYVQPLFWLVTGVLLAIVVVSDLYYGLIPTTVTTVGVVMVVLYRLLLFGYDAYRAEDLLWSVVSGVFAYSFLLLLRMCTKGKGMGEGDPPLGLWLGLLLGYPRILVALWISFVVGAVVGVHLLMSRRSRLGQAIPFGPFLVGGAIVSLLWGPGIWALIF